MNGGLVARSVTARPVLGVSSRGRWQPPEGDGAVGGSGRQRWRVAGAAEAEAGRGRHKSNGPRVTLFEPRAPARRRHGRRGAPATRLPLVRAAAPAPSQWTRPRALRSRNANSRALRLSFETWMEESWKVLR
ncbi:hypothetical protein R5R35_002811 [Gryllus longicercus]|uniref:Uncharacterized protein n=1 Tax=Gryllus longicercus TaxID=2509291 RepID=A0AAN9Z882_9ORTH